MHVDGEVVRGLKTTVSTGSHCGEGECDCHDCRKHFDPRRAHHYEGAGERMQSDSENSEEKHLGETHTASGEADLRSRASSSVSSKESSVELPKALSSSLDRFGLSPTPVVSISSLSSGFESFPRRVEKRPHLSHRREAQENEHRRMRAPVPARVGHKSDERNHGIIHEKSRERIREPMPDRKEEMAVMRFDDSVIVCEMPLPPVISSMHPMEARAGSHRRHTSDVRVLKKDCVDVLRVILELLDRSQMREKADEHISTDKWVPLPAVIRLLADRYPTLEERSIKLEVEAQLYAAKEHGFVVFDASECVRFTQKGVEENFSDMPSDIGQIIKNPQVRGAYMVVTFDGYLLAKELPSKASAREMLMKYCRGQSVPTHNDHLRRHSQNERLWNTKQVFDSFRGEVMFEMTHSPLTAIYGVSGDLQRHLKGAGIRSPLKLLNVLTKGEPKYEWQRTRELLSKRECSGLLQKLEWAGVRSSELRTATHCRLRRAVAVTASILLEPGTARKIHLDYDSQKLQIGCIYEFDPRNISEYCELIRGELQQMPAFEHYYDYQKPREMEIEYGAQRALDCRSEPEEKGFVFSLQRSDATPGRKREPVETKSGVEKVLATIFEDRLSFKLDEFPELYDEVTGEQFDVCAFGFDSLEDFFQSERVSALCTVSCVYGSEVVKKK